MEWICIRSAEGREISVTLGGELGEVSGSYLGSVGRFIHCLGPGLKVLAGGLMFTHGDYLGLVLDGGGGFDFLDLFLNRVLDRV